jgi:gas vesicle protein
MKRSTSNLFIGFFTGIAVGALLGVLYAPDKGSVTRKKIQKRTEEFAEDIEERFDELKEDVTELVDDVKENLSDKKEKLDNLRAKISRKKS